jgi:hypothetical protein
MSNIIVVHLLQSLIAPLSCIHQAQNTSMQEKPRRNALVLARAGGARHHLFKQSYIDALDGHVLDSSPATPTTLPPSRPGEDNHSFVGGLQHLCQVWFNMLSLVGLQIGVEPRLTSGKRTALGRLLQ